MTVDTYQVAINEAGARCVKLPSTGAKVKILEVPVRGRVHIREITKAQYKKWSTVDWFDLPTIWAVLCLAARQYGVHADAKAALEQMSVDLPGIRDNLPDNGCGLYIATKKDISDARKEGDPLPSWELEAAPWARNAAADGRPIPYFIGVKDDPRHGMTDEERREYDELVASTPPWEPLPKPGKSKAKPAPAPVVKRPRPPSSAAPGKPPKGLKPPTKK